MSLTISLTLIRTSSPSDKLKESKDDRAHGVEGPGDLVDSNYSIIR